MNNVSLLNKKKSVKVDNKNYTLPEVLPFRGGGKSMPTDYYYYDVEGYRCPMKDEYFLSGAVVNVHQAPNDLPGEYLVVRKSHKAQQVSMWRRMPLMV